MIITRNWLENFIDLVGVKDNEITVALNSLGFEVDSYKTFKDLNQGLMLGHIGNVSKIDGTHLNFCFVDKGEDLVSPIVCGADNVAEGQYVVLAEPGSKISTGLELQTKEIKGKTSEGMICSLIELGVDPKNLTEKEIQSIYEVHTKKDTYSYIGNKKILDIIGFNDSLWEVDLTLNRSDCLAAFQLLKELANYFDKEIIDISQSFEAKVDNKNNDQIKISWEKDVDEHINFAGSQIFNIKEIYSLVENKLKVYSEHDLWLKFNGVKTTDNFWLDLSNIIAIETGQPILFLDEKVLNKELKIKNETSDDKTTNLQLLNGDEIISTLGMGVEKDYLPNGDSKKVVVVYLSLNPILMRKQQKVLNISSVSLQRWMKPISTELYQLAEKRITYWMNYYNLYDSSSSIEMFKQLKQSTKTIDISLEFINDYLGMSLSVENIKNLFRTLDFEIEIKDNLLTFNIDKFRTDIQNKADIVEEIARLYGYNNIPSVAPSIVTHSKEKKLSQNLKKMVENHLIGLGFNNTKTYSLMNHKEVLHWDLFNVNNPVKLLSPLSQLREAYRLSLSKSLIEVASLNYSRNNKNLKLFECADIYNYDNKRESHVAFLISSDSFSQKAHNYKVEPDFFFVKGIMESVLSIYQISLLDIELKAMNSKINEIHPYLNAEVMYKDSLIGFIFKLNPKYEKTLKLDNTFLVELNLNAIEELYNQKIRLKEISKYQKTSRDLTILLDDKDRYSDIIKKITHDVNFITKIDLVDIYQDELLKKNYKKAVSVSFEFNDLERQLNDEDVMAEWQKLQDKLLELNIEVK